MEMLFCRGCGHQIHRTAATCSQCGAPNVVAEGGNVGSVAAEIPEGVKGWSWGAFLLNWIWAIGNRTWIGLLALIPYVNIIIAVILGIKGREWAWKNKQWKSVEHFNAVQRKWSIWGGIVAGAVVLLGMIAAVAFPAYQDYIKRAENISRSVPAPAVSGVLAKTAASSPYQLPQLNFDPADFVGAMKRAQIEPHWVSEFNSYLSRPAEFWAACVSSEAESAQRFGGMQRAEARDHGKQACRGIAGYFHQCLHKTELGGAILCLQDFISNVEMNGE